MVRKSLKLVLPVVFLALIWPLASKPQEMNKTISTQTSTDSHCVDNLKHIYKLIRLYLHHSAKVLGFPGTLNKIELMTNDPNLFICPVHKQINASVKKGTRQKSYEIVNDPLKRQLSGTPADKIAIVAEKTPNHDGKRFVLFYDGSVRAFDQAQFDKLKTNSFVDAESR